MALMNENKPAKSECCAVPLSYPYADGMYGIFAKLLF